MKRNKLITVILILVLLSFTFTYVYYNQRNLVEVKKVDFDFEISTNVGFNLDRDKLHFGVFRPGSASSTRLIELTNQHDFSVEVIPVVKGLKVGEIEFTAEKIPLGPGEDKEITATARAPLDAPYGNYSGSIYFMFKKVK